MHIFSLSNLQQRACCEKQDTEVKLVFSIGWLGSPVERISVIQEDVETRAVAPSYREEPGGLDIWLALPRHVPLALP